MAEQLGSAQTIDDGCPLGGLAIAIPSALYSLGATFFVTALNLRQLEYGWALEILIVATIIIVPLGVTALCSAKQQTVRWAATMILCTFFAAGIGIASGSAVSAASVALIFGGIIGLRFQSQ